MNWTKTKINLLRYLGIRSSVPEILRTLDPSDTVVNTKDCTFAFPVQGKEAKLYRIGIVEPSRFLMKNISYRSLYNYIVDSIPSKKGGVKRLKDFICLRYNRGVIEVWVDCDGERMDLVQISQDFSVVNLSEVSGAVGTSSDREFAKILMLSLVYYNRKSFKW